MRKALCSIVATVILVVMSGCQNNQPAPTTDADYQRQLDVFDEQSKRTDEQLSRSDKQLDQSEKNMERTDNLLQRWEQQTDRYDKILDKWEKQPAPPQ